MLSLQSTLLLINPLETQLDRNSKRELKMEYWVGIICSRISITEAGTTKHRPAIWVIQRCRNTAMMYWRRLHAVFAQISHSDAHIWQTELITRSANWQDKSQPSSSPTLHYTRLIAAAAWWLLGVVDCSRTQCDAKQLANEGEMNSPDCLLMTHYHLH